MDGIGATLFACSVMSEPRITMGTTVDGRR